jgi:glycosyltransferase involved in cell wall biosynthesis
MASHAPLVLFATDTTGWCFHNISKVLSRKLSQSFRFVTQPHRTVYEGHYDIIVSYWWGNTARLNACCDAERIVGCVYDGMSWKITEDSKRMFKLNMNSMDCIGICNVPFMTDFQVEFSTTPPLYLIEDGVDTSLFKEAPLPNEFTLGWVGNSMRCTPNGPKDYKGLQFIKRVAKAAKVKLKVLDASKGLAWPHEKMPEFYNDISVICIGSCMEGTPNPLLEGMSCGRPALTTDVGLAQRVVTEGETGWYISRNAFEAAVEKVKQLKEIHKDDLQSVGHAAAQIVQRNYDWDLKAKAWNELLHAAIDAPSVRLVEKKSLRKKYGVKYTKSIKATTKDEADSNKAQVKNAPRDLANPGDEFKLENKRQKDDINNCNAIIQGLELRYKEFIKPERPIVYIVDTFRFIRRSVKILEHLITDFKFIVVDPGRTNLKKQPDAILLFYPYIYGKQTLTLARRKKAKLVSVMRGEFWHVEEGLSKTGVETARTVYESSNAVITLSETCKRNTLIECPNIKSSQIYAIPNGGYREEASLYERDKKIFIEGNDGPFFGTLTNWSFKNKAKGALEIAAAMTQTPIKGTLLIGGSPGAYDMPLGYLNDKVYHLGEVDDIWTFFNTIDGYIHHSYQDSQPSTIMEAMSFDCPVFVTKNQKTGSHEFVENGVTGLVCNTAHELLENVSKLSEDDLAKMGKAGGKLIVDKWNWEQTALEYGTVLHSVMNET